MTRALVTAAFVLTAHLAIAQERGDGKTAPLRKDGDDVESLERSLYLPGYRTHIDARASLDDLAKSPDRKRAAKAEAIVQAFDRDAKEWLLSVGDQATIGQAYISITKDCAPKLFAYLYYRKDAYLVGIEGNRVTDAHLAYLSGLPNLSTLDISNTSVTGKTLKQLDLPLLRVLRVNNSPLTDDAICGASFAKLAVLNVANTPVTNKMLKEQKMTDLEGLYVQGTRVDSGGLLFLGRYKKLEGLGVDLDDLSDEVVGIIAAHPSVRFLRVNCHERERKSAEALNARLPRCKIKICIIAPPDEAKTREKP